MSVQYYIQANIICAIIQGLILSNEVTNQNRSQHRIVFANAIMFQILYFITDCFWILVESRTLPRTLVTLSIVNFLILVLTECSAYFWFLYAECLANSPAVATHRGRVKRGLPMIVATALFLIEFLRGNTYYLQDNGHMAHPFLYYATLVLPFGYLVYTCIRCLLRSREKERYADRALYRGLSLYPIMLVLSGVIQLFAQFLPWLCYGSTIAVIYVYIRTLDNMISSDPLTQLNNRNQLDRYIQNLQRDGYPENLAELYFIMIDVNRFKIINDTYGHQAGDEALMLLAGCLKETCGAISEHRPFLARYGGDEFIIAAYAQDETDLLQIRQRIRENLRFACAGRELPYELTVSVGWACMGEAGSAMECIRKADEAMYLDKQTSHKGAA